MSMVSNDQYKASGKNSALKETSFFFFLNQNLCKLQWKKTNETYVHIGMCVYIYIYTYLQMPFLKAPVVFEFFFL